MNYIHTYKTASSKTMLYLPSVTIQYYFIFYLLFLKHYPKQLYTFLRLQSYSSQGVIQHHSEKEHPKKALGGCPDASPSVNPKPRGVHPDSAQPLPLVTFLYHLLWPISIGTLLWEGLAFPGCFFGVDLPRKGHPQSCSKSHWTDVAVCTFRMITARVY